MIPRLERIGAHSSPVVVVDDMSADVGAIVDIAEVLAPFPAAKGVYYPGLRRRITPSDEAAYAYVERTLEAAAPFVAGAFDADRFDLIEASFSMVTTRPGDLQPVQRAPHFDSTDPDYLAVLHFLTGPQEAGTAFYRQRSTGVERVDDVNLARFVTAARRESEALDGYTWGSNRYFEQVAAFEAVPDRLLIYQGALLHSGLIPPDLAFSPKPREGRLTANFFIKARRG